MSTPFQNRLVGTIIVAAAAIIFLPDILDGDKKTYQDNFDTIPSVPQVEFGTKSETFPQDKIDNLPKGELSDEQAIDNVKLSKAEALTEQGVNVKTLTKANEFTQASQSPENKVTKPSTQSLPAKAVAKQAWAIQLGSYRHKNNVDELVRKLKKSGYTVFTRPIKTKNGTLTKVFVGPELIKATLDKKLPELKKLTEVEGKVARFYPTK